MPKGQVMLLYNSPILDGVIDVSEAEKMAQTYTAYLAISLRAATQKMKRKHERTIRKVAKKRALINRKLELGLPLTDGEKEELSFEGGSVS